LLNYTGNNTPAGTVFTFIDNRGAGAIVDPPLTNAPQGGTVPLKARVGTYTYTGGTGNDFTLTAQQTADVQITKTGPASPIPGTDVTYTITVTNGGPDAAANVGVADTLPAGTTFVSLTQNSGPTFMSFPPAVGSGGNVVLSATTLASGATATFTLVVRTSPSATGTLANTAQVTTTTTDSNTANNLSTTTGTFLPQADLQITKTGPANVLSGQNVTYSITVTNAGASDAQTVVIADALPTGTTFVSLTQNTGPTFNPTTPSVGSGGNIVLDAATFAAGATATFTLVVNVGATVNGNLANTAQIASTTVDPNTANNRSTVNTAAVIPDDLQIVKSAPAKVDPGTNLTYTITVANTGLAAASTLVVADMIPANTTFVSLTQTSGTAFDNISTPAVGGTGNVVLNTATFAAGAIATFSLVVLVDSGLTSGNISNTAQVTSITPDSNLANNRSTAITAITQADVQVTKSGPATVVAGQDLTYTITLSNGGTDAATNTTITDVLPAGTTFVSLTQNAGGSGFTTTTPAVGSGGTITISNPSLAVGQVATYTLVVRVPSNFTPGTLNNTASATSLTPDINTANNTSMVSTTVLTQADLSVSKTGPASVIPGQTATYTITFSNTGPSDAQTVSITDALPAGTTFVSLTQNAGGSGFTMTTPTVGSGGTVTISNPTLVPGQVATFTLVVLVNPSLTSADLSNSATATSATTDPTPGNNTSIDVITLTPQADVQVNLTGPANVTAGDNATYTITVTNPGPSDAQSVLITDTLPAGTTFMSLTQNSGPTFNATTPAVSSSGNVILDVSTLPVGASATFTLVVNVGAGFTGTISNTVTAASMTPDPIPSNGSATVNTTVTPPIPPTVRGTIYTDLNANGTRDAGDPGTPGQDVFLDVNGNGVFDAGEPITTTDGTGAFTLLGTGVARQLLAPGEFALGSDGLGSRQSNSITDIPPFFRLFQAESDPNEAFVRSVYRGVLGREGEADGVAGWVNFLQTGRLSRQQVAAAIWTSMEHRSNQVDGYYREYLGREADAVGKQGWLSAFAAGATEEQVALGFLSSAEALASFADSAEFIRELYFDLLGRTASAEEIAMGQAAVATVGQTAYALAVLESEESRLRAIDGYYVGLLNRQGEDAGRQNWLSQLASGNLTFGSLAIRGFLDSDEFQFRSRTGQ
jgi:uncharacterized repeat protein (TIGR01451 family)